MRRHTWPRAWEPKPLTSRSIWAGIELGPALAAWFLARQAERSGAPADPLLFRDPEAERQAAFEKHVEDTSGNPTVR